jgi:hypothetical protein
MKYLVWVIERAGGRWEPNGDGELTMKQAERIVKEIRSLCFAVRVRPVGYGPETVGRDK